MAHLKSGKALPKKMPASRTAPKRCAVCGKIIEENAKYKLCKQCRSLGLTVPPKRKDYPCNTRTICKKCAYRFKLDNHNYICDCLEQTGEIRDLNATDKHCKTFKKAEVNKK